MANEKENQTKKTEPLDHVQALRNVADFLEVYRKWYYGRPKSTNDDTGPNPGGPTPPPPPPNP
jgi:hypothetical protein